MDANQPNDLTPEEIEALVDKLAAYTNSEIGGIVTSVPNASTCLESEPITLSGLMKMKAELDQQFPEPVKFRNGADMSHETFVSLGIPMASKDEGKTWFDPHINRISDIEVHIVPSVPFGKVEECRCKERAKTANGEQ